MMLHPVTMSRGGGLWLRLAAVVLLAFLVLSRAAAGQGTTGALSDPMSTHQLMQFADRLGLDADQRLAIESIHDEYKTAFRKLRKNEIDDFLKEMRASQNTGMMPKRDVIEAMLKKMQRLEARIKSLDDRLFDQLLPTLREEQLPWLDRVRLTRARQRYKSQQMMAMAGGPAVDLSEAFYAVDLPPEVMADADQVIAGYERHLTTAMKRASQATGRMYLDMIEAFEELGYGEMTEEDLTDPEAMKQIMADMQQIWSQVGGKQMEAAAAIADLNRRTYRRVAAFLPPEAARVFRGEYYRAAYPELRFMLSMEKQEWFKWALEHKDLSDEQQAQLAAAVDVHRQKLDRMVDDAVKLIEAHREVLSPFNFDQEAMLEHQHRLGEIQTAARKLRNTTMVAVREIVPERTAAAAVEDAHQKALAFAGVADLLKPETDQDADDKKADDRARQSTPQIDRWIAGPISERDIGRYAEHLDLVGDRLAELHDLHADYSQQFDSLEVFGELKAATQSLWQYNATSGTARMPDADALDRVDQLRLRAIEHITTLDRAFFNDVESLVSDELVPKVARLQTRRLRQMYTGNAVGMHGFGMYQSAAGGIDLVVLVELAENRTFEDDDLQRIDAILAAYEQPATDLFRKRFEAQLAYQGAMRVWSAEAQALQGDPAAMMEYAERYKEVVGDASEKLDNARRNLAQLNRRTIGELVNTLGEPAGASIQLAYDRKAYPSIYKDPVSIERQLKAAYKLKDLTEQQRKQLDLLATTYDPEYLRLSAAMVAHVASDTPNMMNFKASDWQEYRKKQEQLQLIRFDRDELCYRAVNKLKVILGPEQIKRIGNLPAPRDLGTIYR